jgi:hypothetical protein
MTNHLKQSAKAAVIAVSLTAGYSTLASAHSVDACITDVFNFCGSDSACRHKGSVNVSAMVILAAAFLQRQIRRTPSAQIRVACSTKAPSSRIGDRPHLVEHGNAMTTARIAPHATRRNMGRSGAVQLLTGSACGT